MTAIIYAGRDLPAGFVRLNKKGAIQMKKLYILLHIGSLLAGIYDGGNLSAFGILIVVDVSFWLAKIFGPSVMMDRICEFIRK